jgi:sugar lactone lactonase YvrE
LWAVSTAERVMRGFAESDDKRAGLFAFDLATGKLMKKIVAEPADAPHYYDDLAVAPDGRVFVSDGGSGAVYVLPPDGRELSVLVPSRTIQAPNGLAITPDGRRMFVSDYAGFIFRVDLASGAATRLPQPKHATFYGIDGLDWHASGLIGIQNGVDPPRVVRLRLSPTDSEIRRVEVLEMNHPMFAEPTLGVVVGDDFYCVANSHGRVMRLSRESLLKGLSPPAIVRIRLK